MALGLTPRPGRTYCAGAPMLVAHRGGARLAPENTMAAFQSAVDDWDADMLELDVRLTADGHVVVIHDETVDRTTDGSGRVGDMTLAEIQQLDAGYRFENLDGEPSFRGRGVRVPTIEEVLVSCPHIRVNAEAKEPQVAAPLARVIERQGAHDRVLFAAEHERNRSAVRGYAGPWGASRRDCALFWVLHRLPFVGYTPDVDIFQVPEHFHGFRILTPAVIRAAHERNIPVHVWTVNEPDDMRRLLEWGVDGIQSDRLDLLSEVLVERCGRPLPPIERRSPAPAPGGE